MLPLCFALFFLETLVLKVKTCLFARLSNYRAFVSGIPIYIYRCIIGIIVVSAIWRYRPVGRVKAEDFASSFLSQFEVRLGTSS